MSLGAADVVPLLLLGAADSADGTDDLGTPTNADGTDDLGTPTNADGTDDLTTPTNAEGTDDLSVATKTDGSTDMDGRCELDGLMEVDGGTDVVGLLDPEGLVDGTELGDMESVGACGAAEGVEDGPVETDGDREAVGAAVLRVVGEMDVDGMTEVDGNDDGNTDGPLLLEGVDESTLDGILDGSCESVRDGIIDSSSDGVEDGTMEGPVVSDGVKRLLPSSGVTVGASVVVAEGGARFASGSTQKPETVSKTDASPQQSPSQQARSTTQPGRYVSELDDKPVHPDERGFNRQAPLIVSHSVPAPQQSSSQHTTSMHCPLPSSPPPLLLLPPSPGWADTNKRMLLLFLLAS